MCISQQKGPFGAFLFVGYWQLHSDHGFMGVVLIQARISSGVSAKSVGFWVKHEAVAEPYLF
jgi:hypothetical protein